MASPTITRASLLSGPGSLQYGASLKLFSTESIEAAVKAETWRPKISTHGEGAPRLADATAEITFTPAGRITADIIAALFPACFRNPVVGARVFPAADTALVVHGVDGVKLTFPNAALTKMPDLTLSPGGTALGGATFTALIKDNTARETAGAFFATASATWSETFADTDIIAVPYAGLWGATSIPTEEGWKVSFEVGLEPIKVSGIGTVDMRITSVSAKATCKPVSLGVADLMAARRPEGLVLGSSMRQTKNLVITGATGGLIVTLYDAVLTEGPAIWAPNASRTGEITFEASRVLTGTAPSTTMGAVFAISIAAA